MAILSNLLNLLCIINIGTLMLKKKNQKLFLKCSLVMLLYIYYGQSFRKKS